MSKAKVVRAHPMRQEEWTPDEEATDCMRCDQQFSCFNRRHHCRYCGFVLCSGCSSNQVSNLRACQDCKSKYERADQRSLTLINSPLLSKVSALHPLVQSVPGEKPRKLNESPLVRHWRSSVQAMSSPVLGVLPGSLSPKASRASFRQNSPGLPTTSLTASSRAKGSETGDLRIESKSIPVDKTRSTETPKESLESKGLVIVVDPFSTGALVVAECLGRGFTVLRVFSAEFPEHILNLTLDGIRLEYVGTVEHKGDLAVTVGAIRDAIQNLNETLVALFVGCETGVELSDALSEALGLIGNGTTLSEARRNKFQMGEQVRKSGVRAVRQARATKWIEIDRFLKQYGSGPVKVVIKPCSSAGTDNVYLCRSQQEVKDKFQTIIGATNMLGGVNTEVVIQEFLEGKEYVVDSVSRNGVHKVITIWEYDKRPCNGTNFVYFGMRLCSGEGKKEQELMAYMKGVLNALGIVNGAGHGEVMYTPEGPCLVEVGSRPHGGEGSWVPLVNKCVGRNQVQCMIDSILDEKAFSLIPEYPVLSEFVGAEVFLVSQVEGKLISLPKLEEVKKLKSFFQLDLLVKPGERIKKTVDCITRPGSVRLAHKDKIQVEADFLRLEEMQKEGFYMIEKL